jgi:hypothetical protein
MSRFRQFAAAVVLGGAGVLLTPAAAPAQFMGGGVGGFGAPVIVPSGNPFFYIPRYARVHRYAITAPGGMTVSFTSGWVRPNRWSPAVMEYYWYPSYMSSSGYITGSTGSGGGVYNPAAEGAQQDFMRAQRAALMEFRQPAPARTQIYDQWAYEKLGLLGGVAGLKPGEQPEPLQKALAAAGETEVASGEALNHVMVAVVAAESQKAKGVSAHLPPNLLNEIRFTGGPAADAVNLLRSAGRLPFPAAFETPALNETRDTLERDFAAVATPLLTGKPAGTAQVNRLNATIKAAQDRLTTAIRDLSFEDATAARRFLNQAESAAKVLGGPNAPTLVNPKWSAEGANVAELVRFMTRHKLLFGPAPQGAEEAYLALHQGLAAYLFALNQGQAKK